MSWSPADRNVVEEWAHSVPAPYRVVTCAKGLLMAGDGATAAIGSRNSGSFCGASTARFALDLILHKYGTHKHARAVVGGLGGVQRGAKGVGHGRQIGVVAADGRGVRRRRDAFASVADCAVRHLS